MSPWLFNLSIDAAMKEEILKERLIGFNVCR